VNVVSIAKTVMKHSVKSVKNVINVVNVKSAKNVGLRHQKVLSYVIIVTNVLIVP